MKSIISYSRYTICITVIIFAVLFIGCIATVKIEYLFFPFLASYLILINYALIYGAAYIKADNQNIILGSILKSKRIPISNVKSIELFKPTMGAIIICASGGFMGYRGIFREGDIGRYYGFYGKASDCFLIRLKNGDKYVLGCKQPDKMVDYIKSHLHP
ncbi:MAG: PH domain-containing protein [Muribaculaceae bacterium]|nr:PH domain-containing protein [Muribaculaceae bacterium]